MSVPVNRWHGHVCSTFSGRASSACVRTIRATGTVTTARGNQVVLSARQGDRDASYFEDVRREPQSDSSKMVCYGCGTSLQATNPAQSGFVSSAERLEEKARHRQYDHLLCARCQELSHGKMIPGVEDFAQKMVGLGDELELLTPQQLRDELGSRVKRSRSLIVLLVDLLDFSGTMLSNSIRDLIGGNPIIAVGTKMDLLPKQAAVHSQDPRDQDAFFDWFEDSLLFKKLTVVSMHAVSAKTKEGIDEVVADIKQQRLGRDVYIVGAANVGKSAFTRAFVTEMSSMSSKQYDPLAVGKSKRLPMESSMPGTTLSSIPLKVFQSGEKLYDTPGLHIHHRMPHILTPDENKGLHPRKRLVGRSAPAPSFSEAQATPSASDASNASNASNASDGSDGSDASETVKSSEPIDTHTCYAWGGLVRLHVVDCPDGTSLTFFGPDILELSASSFSTEALKGMLQGDLPLKDPENGFGSHSVEIRGGMRIAKKAAIRAGKKGGVLADVAISGIPGWIQIGYDASNTHSAADEGRGGRGGRGSAVRIVVEAPKGIEVFVRPPMPMARPTSTDAW